MLLQWITSLEWHLSFLAMKYPVVFLFLAEYLPWLSLLPLAYLYFIDRKKFLKISVTGVLSLAFAFLLASLLKIPRPPMLEGRPLIGVVKAGHVYSTPSRHASLLLGLLIAALVDPPKAWPFFGLLLVLNAIGRVALGYHRFLDIFAAGLPAAMALAVMEAAETLMKRFRR